MNPTMRNNPGRILLVLLLGLGIALVVIYRDQLNAAQLEAWLEDAGAAAPILFMLVYALGTVLFLPGSLLTLAGGALFGPWWGTFYNLTGATLGAMLSFLVARYLAADRVAQKTGGRLKRLIDGVEQEGWRFVAFTRLVPLFPFNLLNYALGLTRIRFIPYSLATYVCMLPGAIAYTYLGYAGKEAVTGGEGTIQKILLAIALLAAVGFLPRLIGRLRGGADTVPMMSVDALKQHLDADDGLLLLDVRPANDYNGELGHIQGATHVPLDQLDKHMDALAHDLDRPLAIICRTDRMSSKAAQRLVKRGFSNVQVVRMGMVDWNRQGYPVER